MAPLHLPRILQTASKAGSFYVEPVDRDFGAAVAKKRGINLKVPCQGREVLKGFRGNGLFDLRNLGSSSSKYINSTYIRYNNTCIDPD